MRLGGKVALVTGTSPNIGGGIAEALAHEGAAIVAVDSRADNATDCAHAIETAGGQSLGVAWSRATRTRSSGAFEAGLGDVRGIDILDNNAAFFNKGVLDMPLAEWRRQTDVILTGAFLLTKYVAHSMIERGVAGRILNIISTAGHQGEPGNIASTPPRRPAQLHLLGRDGAGRPQHPRQQPDPDRDRPGRKLRARSIRWGREVPSPAAYYGGDGALPARRAHAEAAEAHRLWLGGSVPRSPTTFSPDHRHDLRVDAGAVARYWAWDREGGGQGVMSWPIRP